MEPLLIRTLQNRIVQDYSNCFQQSDVNMLPRSEKLPDLSSTEHVFFIIDRIFHLLQTLPNRQRQLKNHEMTTKLNISLDQFQDDSMSVCIIVKNND